VSEPQSPPDPLQQLCQMVIEQLQVNPHAEVTQLVTHLRMAIEANPSLAVALQEDSRMIQNNQGNSKGYQTWVEKGGIANIGNHFLIDPQQLSAVLQAFLADLKARPIGTYNNLPRSGAVAFVGRMKP